MSYLDKLNPAQKQAVLHKNGPLLILAGAGAGKTRVIAYRILRLIKEGLAPENILAVTFTNKAAKEMQERVGRLLRKDKELNLPVSFESPPFIRTFHSLGVHILRENFDIAGIPKYFSIFDKNDSQKIIKSILPSLNLDPKQFEPKKILGIISRQKGDFTTVSDYAETIGTEYFPGIVATVWQKYEQILAKEKALDFDDLILRTALLLNENKQILNHYQNKWRYLHIDEYQDTNRVQYKIAKFLSQKHKNICVVGDADQNIYSWRGANIKNILNFEKDFPNSQTILLEENYRSTQNILAAANEIIIKNDLRKDKNLWTKNEAGEKVGLYSASDEADEAGFIAQKAGELISDGASPKEIAVLYRTNFQSRILEEAFLTSGVPYQVLGTKFFERKEIKDILAFIKSALNPDSLNNLKRIINTPPRGIGKVSVAKIFANKENELSPATQIKVKNFWNILNEIKKVALNKKPSTLIKFVIAKSGFEDKLKNGNEDDLERLANLQELVSLALKYDKLSKPEGVEKMLEETALASDQDQMDKKTNMVRLMTIHASKGLEFDYVFISGLEDGLFPSKLDAKPTQDRQEEERRLFYVALTRARQKLFLSYSSLRTIFGSRRTNIISEFITDINDNLLEEENQNFQPDTPLNSEKIEYLEW
ncbi:MAG: UvrD-helicase domain-containing protein [Candidatus Pacebacteria bacterium]|nr:UvrD-helicase domain-containing protein [Candidatus Paceibacterota bacterium]